MISWLTLLLLAVCVWVLALQVLIIRQIGILQARAARLASREKPTRTKLKAITYVNGRMRELSRSETTACVLVSTTCHLCAPVLRRIGATPLPDYLSIGLLVSQREDFEKACRNHRLPLDRVFDGRALAHDLAATEVPGLIVVDREGKVLLHKFVDSVEMVRTELQKLREGTQVHSQWKELDERELVGSGV